MNAHGENTHPETFNPWSIVSLVFHHLVAEGLHPVLGESGDPGAPAAELLRALGTITRAGGTCSIIVEQNAQKILGLADRVVILERGAIVHDAASDELKADPAVLERYLGVSGAAAH